MNFFKSYFLAAAFMATGCAHTSINKKYSTEWIDSWESSNSFCVDAYIVNSASAGCNAWTVRRIENVGELRCLEKNKEASNNWVNSTFVFFHPDNPQSIPGFFPICVDSSTVFGVINLQ